MFAVVEIFQHSRTGCHSYSSYIISTFYNWLTCLLQLKYFNILELNTIVTLVKHFNFLELVTMSALVKTLQNFGTAYNGHQHVCMDIYVFASLLQLKHFNILVLVTMVILVISFQCSRTCDPGYSSYITLTFQNQLP